MTLLIFA